MKASELIAELQKGIAEGRDWEVVTPDGTPAQVVYNMPSFVEREDGAEPYITLAWKDVRKP